MLQKLLKITLFAFSVFQLVACSNSSETDLTVYLLEKYYPDLKTNEKESVTALDPLKFIIWKNAKTVYTEAPFGFLNVGKIGVINKDCIIEDKNNWCCYGPKNEHLDLYEYNLIIAKLIAQYDWIKAEEEKIHGLACYYGVKDGKWIIQEKYYNKDSTAHSIKYSVPYWKWWLYKHKFLIK